MATARSILGGIGMAAGGAMATYLFGSYLDSTAGSGTVPYLNEVARGITNILRPVGYVGFPVLGAWYAFLSPAARTPPAPPAVPPHAGGGPTVNVRIGTNRGRIDIGRR